MNGDNEICEYDLFSVIKNCTDQIFISCVEQDIKDIKRYLKYKENFLHDPNASNEYVNFKQSYEIKDIKKFLEEKKKINNINENFL